MLSLGAGFVSMLFFFTAMLVPKIWHATRPVPLIAFGLALVCSAALVLARRSSLSRPSEQMYSVLQDQTKPVATGAPWGCHLLPTQLYEIHRIDPERRKASAQDCLG